MVQRRRAGRRWLSAALAAVLLVSLLATVMVSSAALADTVEVLETSTAAAQVQQFVTEHVSGNLLAGLTPTVSEEGTIVGVNSGSGWNVLTDGDYSTRKSVFPTGLGSGVLRFTFALDGNVEISELLLVCRENNIGMYGLQYEIYIGDDAGTLYTAENQVFAKTAEYTAGGQLIVFPQSLRRTAAFVGFRLTDAKNKYHIGEWGVYGTKVKPLPTVQQTTTDGAAIRSFIDSHTNLLTGLTPAVSEEGTSVGVNSGSGWNVLTDGDYSTRKTVNPTGRGSGVLRFTFTLAQRTAISELLLVCRGNDTTYGMKYEIYVSDDAATLYDETNRVYVHADDTYAAGGQLVSYAEDIRPVGSYVGFRMTDAKNGKDYKYHIGEWGVYGETQESPVEVLETSTAAEAVQQFVQEHLDKNWLAGLTPAVSEEGTIVGVNSGSGWNVLTDGDYSTRKSVFPTSNGTGVLRFTFALSNRVTVSEALLVCRENNAGTYGLDYEIYVGDDAASLYTEEHRVFTKGSRYTGGGQLVMVKPEAQMTGAYVGFRLLDAKNKYHVGEWGIYGAEGVPLPQVKETNTQGTEVQQFITEHIEQNWLKGVVPSVTEEGTSQAVNDVLTQWEKLTDGDYSTRKSVFPTGWGSNVLRYTYALPHHVRLTELLLVCRDNNPGTYGLEYEMYASEDMETLYDADSRVFVKDAAYTGGGQLVILPEKLQRDAYYVGFRLISGANKYHLSELGVYGVQVPHSKAYVTRYTADNEAEIQERIQSGNLLAGIIPEVYDLAVPQKPWSLETNNTDASNWISLSCTTLDGFGLLTDGQLYKTVDGTSHLYKKRIDIMQGARADGLVFTYELKETTVIDQIVVVGMWASFGSYCTQNYKLYVSDSKADLYDGANLVVEYDNGNRFDPQIKGAGAGQMFVFNEKPVGKYFGIHITKENPTDQMVRLDELGVFGTPKADESGNLLQNKPLTATANGQTAPVGAEQAAQLTNGVFTDDVDMRSSGQPVELWYDLSKEMAVSSVTLTAAGDSVIRRFAVYGADTEEALATASVLQTYQRAQGDTGAATVALPAGARMRFLRIVIEEYTGGSLHLSEVEATGSLLQDLAVKNQLRDLPGDKITAFVSDPDHLATVEPEDGLTALVDGSLHTAARLSGGKPLQLLFELPDLKVITGFTYAAGDETPPGRVEYYVGQTSREVLAEDAVPAAVYDGGELTHTAACRPQTGRFVRVVLPDATAASVAEIRVHGFYTEAILDACGDAAVLRSFTDAATGVQVRIARLFSNDNWNGIVRMAVVPRQPTETEDLALRAQDLQVHGSVLELQFFDRSGRAITDLEDRDMTVMLAYTGSDTMYLGQGNGETLWVISGTYSEDGIRVIVPAQEMFFTYALITDLAEEPTPTPDPVPVPTPGRPDDGATDGEDGDYGEDDPDAPEEPEDGKPASVWESLLGKGKRVKPGAIIQAVAENPLWLWLAAAVLAVAVLLPVIGVLILRRQNKRRR